MSLDKTLGEDGWGVNPIKDGIVRAEIDEVTGGVRFLGRANAEVIKGKIGRVPLRVSGIGNSIMYAPTSWWMQCCDKSGGLLVAIDQGHAVPGNTSTAMVARMSDVPASADIVVIMEGTNSAPDLSHATYRSDIRKLIEFYLDRGQLPVFCRPPPRSDSTDYNNKTQKLGMIEYFVCAEYDVPCVDPWRVFADESTGGLSSAAGAVDGKHPGYSAHNLAGAEMLAQLLGTSTSLPLPVANTTYDGLGLLDNPIFLTEPGTYGSGGAISLVTDSAIPGNWARVTGNGAGKFVAYQNSAVVETGDDLFVVKRYSSRSGTVGAASVSAYGENFPVSLGRGIYGDADGVLSGYTGAAPSGGSAHIHDNIFTDGCTDGRYVQIAQAQIYNKTALLTRET